VLLLYQQQAEADPMLEFTQRLRLRVREELGSSVEFYQETLDLDRFAGPEQSLALARYFADKYRGFGVDVVVPVGTRALQFAVERSRDVLPGVPIVFALSVSPPVDSVTLPANVTGRLAAPSRFTPTLAMARALQPDAERIVVIGGAGASDSISMSSALSAVAALRDTLPLTVLRGLPLDVLLAKLRQLPRRSIVLFANFRRDGRGPAFEPLDIVGSMARASTAPMYAQLRSFVGEGVVGGSAIRFDDEGDLTARLLVRVLRRRPGEPMPAVERIPKTFVADWRQLRRWGLDEARLPPGTEIRFRIPSTWERSRGAILAALGIIAAQSLLIGTLLVERAARRRAQRALAEQSEYERTLAELTTDAVRHAPEDAPRALEDALSRVGRYAGAQAAVLVQYPDHPSHAATRLAWTRAAAAPPGGEATAGTADAYGIELPLVVAGRSVGALELYRPGEGGAWPPQLVARLGAAAEVIAGAIARSRAAASADEAARQAAHLGRVALVGELAAAISHELRQPLTAMRWNAELGAELLGRTPPHVAEATQLFDDIVADGARALETVENIRLLLRKQEPGAATVDLNELCRQTVPLLRRDAKNRSARLDLALAPAVPPVVANAAELRQVVLNLALNALDAVAASAGARDVVVGTSAENGVGSVELFVRDSGPGLSPEVQARLFDSFFSTKAHGLGVGLAIVRSIAERHGGRVVAENAPGEERGALFRVVLPAAGPPPVPAPPGSLTERQMIGAA
jgi:signal transduction histidine kinase